jgi:hypothetical protein
VGVGCGRGADGGGGFWRRMSCGRVGDCGFEWYMAVDFAGLVADVGLLRSQGGKNYFEELGVDAVIERFPVGMS